MTEHSKGAHVHGGITMNTHGGEGHAASHPAWKKYVMIGVVLTIITAIEVAIFYIPALEPVLVPVLLTLSGAKFFIVVFYYMHLKSDDAVFSRVFFTPMMLALVVVVGLIILFKLIPPGAAAG